MTFTLSPKNSLPWTLTSGLQFHRFIVKCVRNSCLHLYLQSKKKITLTWWEGDFSWNGVVFMSVTKGYILIFLSSSFLVYKMQIIIPYSMEFFWPSNETTGLKVFITGILGRIVTQKTLVVWLSMVLNIGLIDLIRRMLFSQYLY